MATFLKGRKPEVIPPPLQLNSVFTYYSSIYLYSNHKFGGHFLEYQQLKKVNFRKKNKDISIILVRRRFKKNTVVNQ